MIRQPMGERPTYFRGQLLLEEDFSAEQSYHRHARWKHNLHLHGWGVVTGLEVEAEPGRHRVSVRPGVAIDSEGREIELHETVTIDLTAHHHQHHHQRLIICLHYEEEPAVDEQRRRRTFAVVTAVSEGESVGRVALALVETDPEHHGHVRQVSHSVRRYAGRIHDHSITAAMLEPTLTRGWLRFPFRPMAIQHDDGKPIPEFKLGVTRAESPEFDANNTTERNTHGAGGAIAISVPPGMQRVLQVRLAGEHNHKGIDVELFRTGWNPVEKSHLHVSILKFEIKGEPYDVVHSVPVGLQEIGDSSTLAMRLHGHGKTFVSLVAVEYSR
jgi:hypothetical protein